MADLSNITALSGLTITSDQTTGTNNPNATFAVSSVTTSSKRFITKRYSLRSKWSNSENKGRNYHL